MLRIDDVTLPGNFYRPNDNALLLYNKLIKFIFQATIYCYKFCFRKTIVLKFIYFLTDYCYGVGRDNLIAIFDGDWVVP